MAEATKFNLLDGQKAERKLLSYSSKCWRKN